jgi:NitT/TauT family transport system substrate-binding protein
MRILRCIAVIAFAIAAPLAVAQQLRVAVTSAAENAPFFAAVEKGMFGKLGLDVKVDVMPSGVEISNALASGTVDVGLFGTFPFLTAVSRGVPVVLIGHTWNNALNNPQSEILSVIAREGSGVPVGDLAKLKGKKVGVNAVGSINQYDMSRALQKAGLDPRKDVQWVIGPPQPDLMKMLGQKQVDAIEVAYQFGFFAQNNKWGPIVATGDQVEPNSSISVYAARRDFVQGKRDVFVRFTMAYLEGVKEFNAAATAPDKYPDVAEILAKNTFLGKPEIVRAIAPHWSYVSEDGIPPIDSILAMQDYWADYFTYVEKKTPRSQLFDLSVAQEAKRRLDREKPFAKK